MPYINPVAVLVLIILITFIVLFYFLSPKSTQQTLGPSGVFPISSTIPITDSNVQTILNSPRYTLSFFINPQQTTQKVTNGYLPIVEFKGAWSIDFSSVPDAATRNSSYIQLTTYKKNYSSSLSSESNSLLQIPLQKWTHVAIVRDSRRITIYYNGVTIFSEIFSRPIAPGSILTFGNSSAYITGSFTNITLDSTVSNVEDIKALYNSLSDINGMPYTANTRKFPTLSELLSIDSIPSINFEALPLPPGTIWSTIYE